jgi:hypothetical protein
MTEASKRLWDVRLGIAVPILTFLAYSLEFTSSTQERKTERGLSTSGFHTWTTGTAMKAIR